MAVTDVTFIQYRLVVMMMFVKYQFVNAKTYTLKVHKYMLCSIWELCLPCKQRGNIDLHCNVGHLLVMYVCLVPWRLTWWRSNHRGTIVTDPWGLMVYCGDQGSHGLETGGLSLRRLCSSGHASASCFHVHPFKQCLHNGTDFAACWSNLMP